MEITLKGNGDDMRPDETFTISRYEDRVWVNCDHHEQCGEIYDGAMVTDDAPGDFAAAVRQIIQVTAMEIEAGAAPSFVTEDIG
jgi:hypothetical protein